MKTITILATLALLSACGQGEGTATTTDISGNFQTTLNDTPVKLTLDTQAGNFHGRVVNNFRGPLTVTNGTINFGMAAATMMMGLPSAMEAEHNLFQFLPTVTTYRLTEGRLTLKAADGNSMTFERVSAN